MSDEPIRRGRAGVLEALRQMTPEEQAGLIAALVSETGPDVIDVALRLTQWPCMVRGCDRRAVPNLRFEDRCVDHWGDFV